MKVNHMKKSLVTAVSVISIAGLLFGLTPFVSAKNDRSEKKEKKIEIRSTKEEMKNELRSLRDDIKNRSSRSSSNLSTNLSLTQLTSSTISGTAKIKANLKSTGLYQTKVEVKLNNIPTSTTSTAYEVWLVDSNFKLSLGAFVMNGRSGKATFEYEGNILNLKIYDKLVISEEPINDTNGNPNKDILSAGIPESFSDVIMKSTLKGAFEVPSSTTSTAFGNGSFIINTASNTLKYDITYTGLIGTETGAHIHGPANQNQSADVLFTLPTGTPKIGVWTYNETLENDILSGKTYVNIHSSAFPNGEIRGQIVVK